MTCLGTRPTTVEHVHFTNTARETLLYPVEWSGDWPIINNGLPSTDVKLTEFPLHSDTLQNEQVFKNFTDDFSENKLKPEWVTLRDKLGTRLQVGNGQLKIKGSQITLADLATPSFLGLRQSEHNQSLTITINPDTVVNNGQVGIAVIIDNEHFASIMISTSKNGGFNLEKHIKVFDLEVNEIIGYLDKLPLQFKLINTNATKNFLVKTSNSKEIGFTTNAQHFSNEAAATLNTGDFFGPYVIGDAELVIDHVERTNNENK